MVKKNSDTGILNLGLTSLVAAESTLKQRPLIDSPSIISALDWVDQQRAKGVLPAALVVERAVAAIGSVPRAERTEDLQKRIDQLIETLSATVSAELVQRLRSAESQSSTKAESKHEPRVDTETASVATAPPVVEISQTDRQPEWSRFAEIVSSVQQERVSNSVQPRHANQKGKSLRERFGLRTRVAIAALIFFSLTYAVIGRVSGSPSNSDASEVRFARLRTPIKLSPISSDALMLPRLDPLNQIGSLSSLAYEINTKLPAKPQEYIARQEPARQPVPNDVQPVVAAPAAAAPQKEALDFSKSNEPAVVRELQIEQEPAEPENTFEFPPFIHKPKQQRPKDPHTRDGGISNERVVHFNPPRRYSITAATQVMSRPSYWAPRIGGYDPGDIVSVDAKLGNWIRVVSNFGESAYILAQDAVPE